MLKDFPRDAVVYCFDTETVPDVLALIDALGMEFKSASTFESVIDRFKKERYGAEAGDPMLPLAFQQIVALPCLRFNLSLEAGGNPQFKLTNYISKPLPKNPPQAKGNDVEDRLEWLRLGLKQEADALTEWMADIIADQEAGKTVILLTWNGHGFDMPVVLLRAQRRFPASAKGKVAAVRGSENSECRKKFFKRATHRGEQDLFSRFSPLNVDLMKAIAGEHGFSTKTKQADYAALVGVPGKIKGPDDSETMDGSKVSALYFHSVTQRQRIIEYGSHDVLTLALLFIDTLEGFGMIDEDTRAYYFDQLVKYVESELKAHKKRKVKKAHAFQLWYDDLKRLNPNGI